MSSVGSTPPARPFKRIREMLDYVETGVPITGGGLVWNGEFFTPTSFAISTPSEILTAILTVDGAGSNLDADRLDGLDSLAFAKVANNLSDLANASTARTNLGLGTSAVLNTGTSAGNVVVLGAGGKLPNSTMPNLAITDTFVVGSQVAMLALAAEQGDVAVRTDLNKSFILASTDPTILADWQELLTPTDLVQSVNGMSGVVILTAEDIDGALVVADLAPYARKDTTNTFTDAQTIASGATNNLLIIGSGTQANVYAEFRTAAGGQQLFTFYDAGVAKWSFGKQPDNSFLIFSNQAGATALSVDSATLAMTAKLNPSILLNNTGNGTGNFPQLILQHQGSNRAFWYYDQANTRQVLQSQVGSLVFRTDGANDRVTIATNGDVGIGVVPTATFTVGTANANPDIPTVLMVNSNAAGQACLQFTINGTMRSKWRSDYVGNTNWVANGGDHYFFVNGDYDTGTIAARFRSNGTNGIGLGTTDPQHVLQVGGAIPASVDHVNIKLGVRNGMCVSNSVGKTVYIYIGEGLGYGMVEAYDYANVVGIPLVLNPNGGSVGIGLTGPSATLHVETSANQEIFHGKNTSTWTQYALERAANAHQVAFKLIPQGTTSPINPTWYLAIPPNESGFAIQTWDGTSLTTRLGIQYNGATYVMGQLSGDSGADFVGVLQSNGVQYIDGTGYYILNTAGGSFSRTKVDGGLVYDQRALITNAGDISDSNTTVNLYNYQLIGGAGGWVDIVLTIYDATYGVDLYQHVRWRINYGAGPGMGITEVYRDEDDPGNILTVPMGVNISDVGAGEFRIDFQNSGGHTIHVSWTVTHKFGVPGTVSGYA
jgi:hypothetical protein